MGKKNKMQKTADQMRDVSLKIHEAGQGAAQRYNLTEAGKEGFKSLQATTFAKGAKQDIRGNYPVSNPLQNPDLIGKTTTKVQRDEARKAYHTGLDKFKETDKAYLSEVEKAKTGINSGGVTRTIMKTKGL